MDVQSFMSSKLWSNPVVLLQRWVSKKKFFAELSRSLPPPVINSESIIFQLSSVSFELYVQIMHFLSLLDVTCIYIYLKKWIVRNLYEWRGFNLTSQLNAWFCGMNVTAKIFDFVTFNANSSIFRVGVIFWYIERILRCHYIFNI